MNKEACKKAEECFEDVEKEEVKEDEVVTEEIQEEEETKTEEVSEEDEAIQTKYLRLMADFQNYKKRSEKEKGDIYTYANEKIVTELLNVVDNFERGLAQGSDDGSFVEGMDMIFKQLMTVLDKFGVVEINALGEVFDPNIHNAVMTEDNDDFESGHVTEVLQKGYTLNGKVVRPSMVKVNN